ncbi:MAG: MoaD/ThiS family protein [Bacillota bacterium]
MVVEVRVFSGLEKFIQGATYGKPIEVSVDEGTTVGDLIKTLKVPEKDIFAILINGVHSNKDYFLKEKDRVAFFPPVGGG